MRPSFLSPLFTVWQRNRDEEQRGRLLLRLLAAHRALADSISGQDGEQVLRAAQARVARIKELAADVGALMRDGDGPAPGGGGAVHASSSPPPSRCDDRALLLGFYSLLDRQAEAAVDPAARAFERVQRGEQSPYEHFRQHFLGRYVGAPGLQPLEVVYARPDPDVLLKQLQEQGARAAGAGTGPVHGAHIDAAGAARAIGKRKTSVAHVVAVPRPAGRDGRVTINGEPLEAYFPDTGLRAHALRPLLLAGAAGQYDVRAHVRGGGFSGQAQAVGTGVARALCLFDPTLRAALHALTRWDGRVVERKKPARKKARRGFQWVKR